MYRFPQCVNRLSEYPSRQKLAPHAGRGTYYKQNISSRNKLFDSLYVICTVLKGDMFAKSHFPNMFSTFIYTHRGEIGVTELAPWDVLNSTFVLRVTRIEATSA